jgi:hypothetical protein
MAPVTWCIRTTPNGDWNSISLRWVDVNIMQGQEYRNRRLLAFIFNADDLTIGRRQDQTLARRDFPLGIPKKKQNQQSQIE